MASFADDLVLDMVIAKGGVPAITWKVEAQHAYKYMAIYIHDVSLWYIAGEATFYDGPTKTTAEMLRLLKRDEVIAVFRNTQDWTSISL